MNSPAFDANSQQSGQAEQMVRLVDWNTEVLLKLLKRIVSKRQLDGKSTWSQADPADSFRVRNLPLEEVQDVIQLPEYKPSPSGNQASVELDPQIESQLRQLVAAIAASYPGNRFHCLQHASQVALVITKLVSRIGVTEMRSNGNSFGDEALHAHTYGISSDPITQYGAVFAALIHSLSHPGISNDDLKSEQPQMCKRYQNNSVIEQLSVEKGWGILMQPQFKALRQCIYADAGELMRFRQVVVNCALATDNSNAQLLARRQQRWQRVFAEGSIELADEMSLKATIVLEHIMQAADAFHAMQDWNLYLKWMGRLYEELVFAFQEKRSKVDPSDTWFKSQLEFFDGYVIPLAMDLKEMDSFLVNGDEYLTFALKNRRRWASSGMKITEELKRKATKQAVRRRSLQMVPEVEIPAQVQRLTDWNVQLLLRQLNRIRYTGNNGETGIGVDLPPLKKLPIDELKEYLSFEEGWSVLSGDSNHGEVDLEAQEQLREYISSISMRFDSNLHFHCLEHSSQVALVASKLLSRVVKECVPPTGDEQSSNQVISQMLAQDQLAQFSIVLAALTNEVEHPGVPNNDIFLDHPQLAEHYKNRCISEQQAVQIALGELARNGYENFRAAIYKNKEEMERFRAIMIQASLATGFEDELLQSFFKSQWSKAFGDDLPSSESAHERNERKVTIAIVTLMQAASAFHTMQHWHVYIKWAERLFNETCTAYYQGKLSESPAAVWYEKEKRFFDNYVIPLCERMETLRIFGATAGEALRFAKLNRKKWESKGYQIVGVWMSNFNSKRIGASHAAMM